MKSSAIDSPSVASLGRFTSMRALIGSRRQTRNRLPGSQLRVYEGGPYGLLITHVNKLNVDLRSLFAEGATGFEIVAA